ncbi:MAG: HEAT repeat domain-containing protein [Verrucomicrobiota bacterium]
MNKCRFFLLLVFAFPGLSLADEASALKVLASADSSVQDKAMACDELGRVGGAAAVPVLVNLLADEKLQDYARDGLERINDPAVGKALLGALTSLKGHSRVGVIITLGDRREKAAVDALAKIAKEKDDRHAVEAALSSLAQIASDEAGAALLAALTGGEVSKSAAARSALAAADRMDAEGRKAAADKLRKAVAGADVPGYIKKVAGE